MEIAWLSHRGKFISTPKDIKQENLKLVFVFQSTIEISEVTLLV